MNYMVVHRNRGDFGVIGLDGTIRWIEQVKPATARITAAETKALENLKVGEYFYVGPLIIIGVSKGITIEELAAR